MLFILHAEANNLCLKDLSSDVTEELNQRIQADKATLEKFYQFFGLNLEHRFGLPDLRELFPDTAVRVLKECFEVLRLHDLAELPEKVKPRSLRPALSPDQIEKLRRVDARPTKCHSNVTVLVVDFTVEENIVEREDVKKIDTFFKDLNSRNEVTTISLASSQGTREGLRKIKMIKRGNLRDYHLSENSFKKDLEDILQRKACLEKEMEMRMEKEHKWGRLKPKLSKVYLEELMCRGELKNIVKAREQAESAIEKLKELEKESEKSVSKAMDEWIYNQGWLTLQNNLHFSFHPIALCILIEIVLLVLNVCKWCMSLVDKQISLKRAL